MAPLNFLTKPRRTSLGAMDKLDLENPDIEEFGVNRTSIREAIKILEGLRLVAVRQGNGATVQPLIEGSLDLLGPMIVRKDT